MFARCIGFVFQAPGFANKAVSPVIRAAFAFSLTLLLAPSVPLMTMRPDASYFLGLVGEVAVGATIGYASAVLYQGIDAGGQALDDFVGIRSINPTAGAMAGVGFGRLWSFLFVTAYFILGGYALPLTVFASGLHTVPPGSLFDPHDWQVFAFRLPQLIIQAALFVAGPALVVGLITQLTLAAVGRIVPRFSVQALTFGIQYAVVLLVTLVTLPLAITLAGHAWIPLPLPGVAHQEAR